MIVGPQSCTLILTTLFLMLTDANSFFRGA
jgi:hypothetical protein